MSHSVDRGDGSVSVASEELRISLGISLPLGNVADGSHSRSVTDDINDLNAERLVLNLLGLDGLGGADVLGPWCASLGGQGLDDGLAVGGGGVGNWSHWGSGEGSSSQELRVSLGISGRGGASKGNQTGDGKYLRERS